MLLAGLFDSQQVCLWLAKQLHLEETTELVADEL
jgi:hypothetical protein